MTAFSTVTISFSPMISTVISNDTWYYDYVRFSDILKGDPHNYYVSREIIRLRRIK